MALLVHDLISCIYAAVKEFSHMTNDSSWFKRYRVTQSLQVLGRYVASHYNSDLFRKRPPRTIPLSAAVGRRFA